MSTVANRLPSLKWANARRMALVLAAALAVEAALVAVFARIPNARAYVPLRFVDSAEAYNWSPDDAPRWFQTDDPTLPQAAYFREAAGMGPETGGDTFERQLAIMDWVRQQALVVDSVQTIPGDPITVREAMLAGTPAQCGNFATLYAATSASAGLTGVRTWFLLSDDGPNGWGHILNEVWVPELGKWVMVDPMNNAYALRDGEPASLVEVREMILTGQRGRLEFVTGANGHTPPERLFDLYEVSMPIVSLAGAHTPLANAYRQTWSDQVVARLPDVANLPFLADRAFALMSGEARQVTLIDDLARERMERLPIAEIKALFAAMLGVGALMAAAALRLAWLGLRHLLDSLTPSRQAASQPG
jgi:transglutaminase-like putative cysteine protease